jgi:pyrroloquinoline quinone biosynthesis protein E
MLISEAEFHQKYGAIYETELARAQEYVNDPGKLRYEVEKDSGDVVSHCLRPPVPDPFTYRMMLYKGFIRYPERLKNYIVARNEPRTRIRSFLPTIIDVEPVSRCNYCCIMCTVSDWPKGKRADDLTLEEFKGILDELPSITEMKLQGMGEPLLHRDFFKMIELVVERFIWVRSTINGSLLNIRDNYRRLIDSGIGEVQTSFDGATKKVFEKIRRGSNFEQVVRNLTLLNDYANQQDRPYTRMWVVLQKYNRHQVFGFVDLARKMGFRRITFSVGLVDWGQDKWHASNERLQANQLTFEEQQRLSEMAEQYAIDISTWDSTAKYTTESEEKMCPAVFNRASITSDARLVPCSMLSDPRIVDLGDAKEFKREWNSLLYQAFRQAHLLGNVPQCCRGCYKYLST